MTLQGQGVRLHAYRYGRGPLHISVIRTASLHWLTVVRGASHFR